MLFITALVIFDETQTGLGRTGEHFWGFQNYGNIVPDILTCGRPLGAGHPIGACITSSRVARRKNIPISLEMYVEKVLSKVWRSSRMKNHGNLIHQWPSISCTD